MEEGELEAGHLHAGLRGWLPRVLVLGPPVQQLHGDAGTLLCSRLLIPGNLAPASPRLAPASPRLAPPPLQLPAPTRLTRAALAACLCAQVRRAAMHRVQLWHFGGPEAEAGWRGIDPLSSPLQAGTPLPTAFVRHERFPQTFFPEFPTWSRKGFLTLTLNPNANRSNPNPDPNPDPDPDPDPNPDPNPNPNPDPTPTPNPNPDPNPNPNQVPQGVPAHALAARRGDVRPGAPRLDRVAHLQHAAAGGEADEPLELR